MVQNESQGPWAVVLAPHGRDAEIALMLLRDTGVASISCTSLEELAQRLTADTAFVVVTEEAMEKADLRLISRQVLGQPPWSALQFIVLTRRGGGLERNPQAARLSETLLNVTFLERPFHPTTFVSLARTALRSRLRQLQGRDSLAQLHESEERLRTALVAGRLGAWQFNLENREFIASESLKLILGYAAEASLSFEELLAAIHPEDRAYARLTFAQVRETSGSMGMELRCLRRDGTHCWIELHGRMSQWSDRGSALVGVCSDITARKMQEKSLREINETLEMRVAERTRELEEAHASVLAEINQRELAEEQLRQAQKMETIGQLTGGVAHDFNNLLMAIMGNLDLLRKHVEGDIKAARFVDGAIQGAQRGASLTQRLLAFARRQALTMERRSFAELVDGMKDLLHRSVGSEIELVFELPATTPGVQMDINQLELALLNLVVNARDAMPEGGIVTISADLPPETDRPDSLAAGDYVRLMVRDTGQGMDADTLSRAAEPFFSTKGLGKGTGLGLSMIHGLALQMNGALRLSSEPGQGTLAELWLPAAAESDAVAKDAVASSSAATAPAPVEPEQGPGTSFDILFVDDDALIALSTVDMLEDLGHRVTSVFSGAQALEILQGGQAFDLLITDYSMPKMTGAQLAAAARELFPDLPVLLATGYAELPSGSELQLPRLAKPYLQQTLADEISKLMSCSVA